FERTDSLHQGFFEGAADGHHFAHGFHLSAEGSVRAGEFFELPFGDFCDDVVDGGLEAGGGLLGDVVRDFIQGHADGQLGGDFGDGEAGGFAGQGGTAGDTRVHFNDDHAAGFGVNGKLDIGAACFDADLTDDARGGVAHALVFAVGEGLRRGHGDGITGVDAHGVEILDGADDHEVVAEVAHDFELEVLPAEDGFVDEGCAGGAAIEGVGDGLGEFLAVVSDTAAGAAEGDGRADHDGIAKLVGHELGLGGVADDLRARDVETDAAAGVLELQTIFGNLDGAERGANQLHAVAVEDAGFGQLDGEI